jgi:MFS family permease
MPRPNPPRKRPRRRPDTQERSARAEVSLAKQTAQVKEKNGSSDGRQPSNAKQVANLKGRPAPKGRAGWRGGRIDEPYVPWARRSYLILVAVLAAAEVVVGSLAFFTIPNPKPAFGLYVLGVSYNPLVPVAAALVAAPLAKLITKEQRSLRFMESAMAGILQYFVWLALFVALEYLTGGFVSSKTAAVTVSTPAIIVELIVIDVLSFAATFLLYPWLNKFMRRRPPPSRTPPAKKAKPEEARQSSKSIVDRMDEASARDPQAKGPTP